MRYFKYKFYSNIVDRENKFRLKQLNKKAKRNNKINHFTMSFFIVLYIALVIILILTTKYLRTMIESRLLEGFMIAGMVIAIIFVPIAIVVLIYKLIGKYIPSATIGELTLEVIEEVTKPLKKYYSVTSSSIVTKCYKSFNESFINKDVMIYQYKDKIRITLDFNRTTKDFGCYEFSLDEIECSYIEDNGLVKALLKCDDVYFELGRRAKPFIRKCFNKLKCPCCGYYTFTNIERGQYDICPVCFWEDDPFQEKDVSSIGANRVTLAEAKINYKKFGACEKELVRYCRPPKGNEIKRL